MRKIAPACRVARATASSRGATTANSIALVASRAAKKVPARLKKREEPKRASEDQGFPAGPSQPRSCQTMLAASLRISVKLHRNKNGLGRMRPAQLGGSARNLYTFRTW